jgi:tetratricopeptide (TPR) repeat protein
LKFQILKKLLREKVPFFALMILFCVATYFIQRDYAAMTPWEKLGLAPRLQNAIAGYVAYLGQLFWPLKLAAIYPYPKSFDPTLTALKAAWLLAISAFCVTQVKPRPQLMVGWCWYLGTALPVIGLVQVGEQAMADRYTYLPLIGPVVALVWTAAEFFTRSRGRNIFGTAAVILILSGLVLLSARQIGYWRNTIELFAHNIEVTPENSSANFTLALGYEHAGDTHRALVYYRVAKMIEPRDFQNRRNLASLLGKTGQLAAAETEYRALIADEPAHFQNHLGLAGLLGAQGREDESLVELNETLRLNPEAAEALNNLAWALATDPRAAVRDGARAVALAQRACEQTQFARTMFIGTLAAAQAEAGKFDAAVATAQKACEIATKNGEKDLLQRNQELLERYRTHKTARPD